MKLMQSFKSSLSNFYYPILSHLQLHFSPYKYRLHIIILHLLEQQKNENKILLPFHRQTFLLHVIDSFNWRLNKGGRNLQKAGKRLANNRELKLFEVRGSRNVSTVVSVQFFLVAWIAIRTCNKVIQFDWV